MEPLRTAVYGRELHEGDLAFTPEGDGVKHDALIKVGANSILLLNHSKETIDDVRANSRWLAVQAVLFELSEGFVPRHWRNNWPASIERAASSRPTFSATNCPYNRTLRRRSAFVMTETDESDIAAPAIIGLRSSPKNG